MVLQSLASVAISATGQHGHPTRSCQSPEEDWWDFNGKIDPPPGGYLGRGFCAEIAGATLTCADVERVRQGFAGAGVATTNNPSLEMWLERRHPRFGLPPRVCPLQAAGGGVAGSHAHPSPPYHIPSTPVHHHQRALLKKCSFCHSCSSLVGSPHDIEGGPKALFSSSRSLAILMLVVFV